MGLLDDVLGGRTPRAGGGGMSPLTMALVGLLAYRTFQGKGRLAEMLGRKAGEPSGSGSGAGDGGMPPQGGGVGGILGTGGLGGMLRGLLGGGAAGGVLSGGLGDLLRQFQQNGQGEKADSWVANGPNKQLSPSELEQALGSEKISWLMNETGLRREELLAGLSRELPNAVDKLTPDGRIPNEHEAAGMI
jgi:uncharacterized protein YidB (DUF937 family)